MIRLSAKLRTYISNIVLCALLFNSTGSLFAASSMLKTAQGFADADSMLICTGSTYKWISLKAFELNGLVEFIDPPENAPTEISDLKCSYAYLAEPNSDNTWSGPLTTLSLPIETSTSIHFFSALYANAKHQLALSRAPPYFS